MEINKLDRDDVVRIHEHLVEEFSLSGDPIEPAGIRDENLLGSAVSRQWVGSGDYRKYDTPASSAATLAYGVCNNHVFHNGNKRTALVCILVHLDANRLSLWGTDQSELYDFMLAVADHRIVAWAKSRVPSDDDDSVGGSRADSEVEAMSSWLQHHIDVLKRGERKMSYRELRRALNRFGYDFAAQKQSQIHIVRVGPDKPVNIMTIYYPGERREVSLGLLKKVRSRCNLREEDGIDSEVFYDGYNPVDEFINKYRVALRRLGKT